MMSVSALFVLLLSAGLVFSFHPSSIPRDPTPYERAKALVGNMTTSEKLHMVHGESVIPGLINYAGHISGNDKLKIPALNLQDGPQGVGDLATEVTCWPSALTIAATWDVDLMYQFAQGTANEERGKGANIHLSPMVNIVRVPMAGRNYETFGEDPVLSSKLVVASIQGIQSQGLIATVKHWAIYNQEYERTKVSANVDERTAWEIYYPAFQAAINAGVGAVMCSYNRINNTHACENAQTISDLKDTMNFQGFLMSDWFATHSTVDSANNGLDMEMPAGLYFGLPLTIEVELGNVPQARVDDMATRILTSMFAAGIFDTPQTGNLKANVTSEAHNLLARSLAASGTVLLRNFYNLLPLSTSLYQSIAVIGDDAYDNPIFHGTGSGDVKYEYMVTPLDGIKARAGPNVTVTYANSQSIPKAIQVAQAADVAIVFVAVESGEGHDRANLSLPYPQDELIAAVAKANPNVVVVIHGPGAVLMNQWIDSVKSVVYAFFPGQEDGNAIAMVLFGDINPSARLPMTFPMNETEIPVNTPIQYPGINEETNYTEKLLVGYRWYDANNITPLFPFGHGLSYSSFWYQNLTVTNTGTTQFNVSLEVMNTGDLDGYEVVQLYLGFPEEAGEPPKVLRDFDKVFIKNQGTVPVSFVLEAADFSIWDVVSHDWLLVHGTFTVYVGASSRDIRCTETFSV